MKSPLTAPPDALGALYFLPGQYLFKRTERCAAASFRFGEKRQKNISSVGDARNRHDRGTALGANRREKSLSPLLNFRAESVGIYAKPFHSDEAKFRPA